MVTLGPLFLGNEVAIVKVKSLIFAGLLGCASAQALDTSAVIQQLLTKNEVEMAYAVHMEQAQKEGYAVWQAIEREARYPQSVRDMAYFQMFLLTQAKNTDADWRAFLAVRPDTPLYLIGVQAIYQRVVAANTPEKYVEFMQAFPKSVEAVDAALRVQQLAYDKTVQANTVEAFEKFIEAFPNAEQIPQAREKIHELAFAQAKAADTVAAMDGFIAQFPSAKQADEARALANQWHLRDLVKQVEVESDENRRERQKDRVSRGLAVSLINAEKADNWSLVDRYNHALNHEFFFDSTGNFSLQLNTRLVERLEGIEGLLQTQIDQSRQQHAESLAKVDEQTAAQVQEMRASTTAVTQKLDEQTGALVNAIATQTETLTDEMRQNTDRVVGTIEQQTETLQTSLTGLRSDLQTYQATVQRNHEALAAQNGGWLNTIADVSQIAGSTANVVRTVQNLSPPTPSATNYLGKATTALSLGRTAAMGVGALGIAAGVTVAAPVVAAVGLIAGAAALFFA